MFIAVSAAINILTELKLVRISPSCHMCVYIPDHFPMYKFFSKMAPHRTFITINEFHVSYGLLQYFLSDMTALRKQMAPSSNMSIITIQENGPGMSSHKVKSLPCFYLLIKTTVPRIILKGMTYCMGLGPCGDKKREVACL